MPIRNESELRRQLGFRRGMDDRDLSTDGEMSLSARAGRSMPVSASRILGGTGAGGASSVSPNQIGYGKTPQIAPAITEQIAKPPATLKDMLYAPETQRRGQVLPDTAGPEELETQRVFRNYQQQLATGQAGITGKRSLMSILRNVLEGANIGLQQGGPWGALAGAGTGAFFGSMPGQQFEQMRANRDRQAYQSKLQAQLGPQLEIAKGIDEARVKQADSKTRLLNAQANAKQVETNAQSALDLQQHRLRTYDLNERKFEQQKSFNDFKREYLTNQELRKTYQGNEMIDVARARLGETKFQNAFDRVSKYIEADAFNAYSEEFDSIYNEASIAAARQAVPPSQQNGAEQALKERAKEAANQKMKVYVAQQLSRLLSYEVDKEGTAAPAASGATAPKGNTPAPKSGGTPAPASGGKTVDKQKVTSTIDRLLKTTAPATQQPSPKR